MGLFSYFTVSKRSNNYKARGVIIDRIMIDKRPKLDRKSKFTLIKNIKSKQTDVFIQAFIEMITPIKGITHTIINNNGKEFAYHKEVSQTLDTKLYFGNLYHSWETNGLIRQYLPKK